MFCCGGMHTKHVEVGYLLNEINTSNVNELYVAFFNQKQLPDIVCFFQSYIVQSYKFAFSIRHLKIARFQVRVRVGLPVPVLGYTGNQSNLRYTGDNRVRSGQSLVFFYQNVLIKKYPLKST